MQVPTTLAQIAFIFVVALQVGIKNLFAPMSPIQRGLIGVLVVYVLFVSFTSPVPSSALLAPSWVVHIFFFVALISFFSRADPDRIEIIWTIVGLTALLHVCAFLIAWAVWPEEIRQFRLPAFDNIRHLGYFLAPAAAMAAVQFVVRRDKALCPLLCFAAAVFYILYTGSRGGTVAVAAGLTVAGVFMVWYRQQVQPSRVVALLVITCIAIVISELLPSLPWKPVFGRGVDAISQTGTQMLSGRREVWTFAAIAIQQNWLWGYGPAIMGQIPEYQGLPYRHPHNIVLQVLLHWGLIGTMLILGAFMSFIPNVMSALRRQPALALVPLSLIATMCIHAIVDGGLFYPFSTAIAIIAFARLEVIGRRHGRNDIDQPETGLDQIERMPRDQTGNNTASKDVASACISALRHKTQPSSEITSQSVNNQDPIWRNARRYIAPITPPNMARLYNDRPLRWQTFSFQAPDMLAPVSPQPAYQK
ncbi:O-antigen ligase family protein [Yoonia algicola]|uniref:O-antigen ligase family protein n=1 Tax=Yoonia algicola TaxID=3137368 RepID=A0AAN0NIE9_9RHOB